MRDRIFIDDGYDIAIAVKRGKKHYDGKLPRILEKTAVVIPDI